MDVGDPESSLRKQLRLGEPHHKYAFRPSPQDLAMEKLELHLVDLTNLREELNFYQGTRI